MENTSERKHISFIIEEDNAGRIDTFLGNKIEGCSRSQIQKLFTRDCIFVNGSVCKEKKEKLCKGDFVEVWLEAESKQSLEPYNESLDIVFEDKDIIVINKARGMVVHPGAGNEKNTLVNALIAYLGDEFRNIGEEDRPGIVHRIDKDTSGILVVAKSDLAYTSLRKQFDDHSIERRYMALVYNNMKDDEGTIDKPIGRDSKNRLKKAINGDNPKNAITHYKVVERYGDLLLIEAKLETGRTHQIRVHLASIGHPLVGDLLYGPKKDRFKSGGQILHAAYLGFIHPSSGEFISFESELPAYFIKAIDKAKKMAINK